MGNKSNKLEIQEKLCKLILDEDEPFVAMLSGEWGIGKTYFWNEFKEKFLEPKQDFMRGDSSKIKRVVYISLFSKNSLEEIQADIISQISQWTKGIEAIKSKFNNFTSMFKGDDFNIPLPISSLLSLLGKKNFKNIVICFDDFERLSDKVSLKDVMGLISQFKEQKKCKIIMILNEGELSQKNTKIFSNYKEKIVDYSFLYMPNNNDLYLALDKDIKQVTFCEEEVIFDFFKKINLQNIRIMKQSIHQLKAFNFINLSNFNKEVLVEFTNIALNLFIFKAKNNYNYTKFLDISHYLGILERQRQWHEDEEHVSIPEQLDIDENKEYDKLYKEFIFHEYIYLKDELEYEIYTFIDTYIMNKEKIHRLIIEKIEKIRFKKIEKNIRQVNFQYSHSFNISDKETSIELISLIKEYNEVFHLIFQYEDFKQFFQNIETYTPTISLDKEKNKLIIENYIKYYADNPEKDEKGFHTRKTNLLTIIDDYSWGKEYLDKYKEKNLIIQLDDIINIIKEVYQKKSCSDEQIYQLNNFTYEEYKSLILKNNVPKFIDSIVYFCSWDISGADINPIKDKIKLALEEIMTINSEYERKVKSILKHAELEF